MSAYSFVQSLPAGAIDSEQAQGSAWRDTVVMASIIAALAAQDIAGRVRADMRYMSARSIVLPPSTPVTPTRGPSRPAIMENDSSASRSGMREGWMNVMAGPGSELPRDDLGHPVKVTRPVER